MDNTAKIWKEYHSKLLSFINGHINDRLAADDILQDVFVRIHSKLGTLKETNNIRGWIYQVTRNAIIDYYRSHKKTAELPEVLSAPEADLTEGTRREIASWLLPMIEDLPEEYRQALMMSEIDGMTQKEIAKKQGISLPGAKSRIQRGRKMIKDMLVGCCQFEFDHRGKLIDYKKKS